MSIEQTFGSRVRETRLAKGWSQETLADKAELDRTYISGIERGVRNPTLTTVARIARALGVKLAALLPKDDAGTHGGRCTVKTAVHEGKLPRRGQKR